MDEVGQLKRELRYRTVCIKKVCADLSKTREAVNNNEIPLEEGILLIKGKLMEFDHECNALKSAQKKEIEQAVSDGAEDTALDELINRQNSDLFEYESSVSSLKVWANGESVKADYSLVTNKAPTPTLVKLPELKLPFFDENKTGPFEYQVFADSFHSILNAVPNLNEPQKFIYLKSSLRGKALSLVSNLPLTDSVFSEACKILEDNFLNKEEIVEGVFAEMFSYPTCKTPYEIDCMINFFKLKLQLLEGNSIRFSSQDNETGGKRLLAHLIRTKIPSYFMQELIRKSDSSFPSLDEIFDNAHAVANMYLVSRNSEATSKNKHLRDLRADSDKVNSRNHNSRVNGDYKVKLEKKPSSFSKPNDKNYASLGKMLCKFCGGKHSSLRCTSYKTFSERQERAREMKLCTRCLSSKHLVEDCVSHRQGLPFSCSGCQSSKHVSPMCPSPSVSMCSSKVRSIKGEHL